MDRGVPQTTAVRVIGSLRPFSRSVTVRSTLTSTRFAPLVEAGAGGICVGAGERSVDEAPLMTQMDRFVRAKKHHRLTMTMDALHSLGLATYALCAGFGNLRGPAIHGLVDAPDTMCRFRYQDILRSVVNRSR